MNITAEEKLMYEVMKAIYESGMPISFKGSMVLRACLLEAGYKEETRHTVDIDANWNSEEEPSSEQIAKSIQMAMYKCGVDLEITAYREYNEKRSAGFELRDKATGEVLFTMDIDVNRPVPPTKIYEIDEFKFCGVSSTQMIADKLAVISTNSVFRRIKDVVDLYYLSKVIDFDKNEILNTLKDSGRTLGDFHDFLHNTSELKHSYEKFRFTGGVDKPDFDEVYFAVKIYIKKILTREKYIGYER